MRHSPDDRRREEAWQTLVDRLVDAGTLRTPRIIQAFQAMPRWRFVPDEIVDHAASLDAALPIGEGQTVSQPTTVAIMLELVAPAEGENILDIGTGSGWQAALLAFVVGPRGHVSTIERIPRLAERAKERLDDAGVRNVTTLVGDATRGLPSRAPFAVIVAAAESRDVPRVLVDQLAAGGRFLQPIAGMGLRVVSKDAQGAISTRDIPGFVFVPLIPSGEEPKTVPS